MAAAATTSRTVAVSFLISHTVTDGQGMLAGLATALGPDRPPASLLRSPTRRADLADAIGAGGRAHARVTLATTTQMGHDFNPLAMALNGLRAARRRRQAPVSPPPHITVLVVDSNELAAVAARYGGTATSLSIALTANTTLALDDSGDQRIRLQMPVSRRAHDSPRGGNEVAATVVDLGPSHGRYTDLARIRSISKQAYAHAAPVVMGAIADCDAALSSVGAIPTVVANAFGTPTAMIPRSLRRRMPSNLPLSARPSIMVFRTFTDLTTTFTFVGSHDRIASVAAAEFTAWGISPVAQWQNTRPDTR
ncbi:hypothetical protein [Nocardia brasiliensis]|uniref:hypothetical protein n=1 Tax=Nocardia brasiliensis TaxID=37326 RepID=UPI0011DCA0AC|nr:hypothetical protein [Nocardia brasiliensis]